MTITKNTGFLTEKTLCESIVAASPDVITFTDLDGKILFESPNALALHGCTKSEDYIGKNVLDFLVEEDRERAKFNIELMFQGIFTGPGQYRFIKADGSIIDIEVNAEFVRNADGSPASIVMISRDITERKRMTEELARVNENITTLNKSLAEMNEKLEQRVAERTSDLVIAQQDLVVQVKELKQMHEVLQQSEKRFQFAVDASENTLFDVDLVTGKYIFFPEIWDERNFFKVTNIDEYVRFVVHPDDREGRAAALAAHVEGRTHRYQAEYRIIDGKGGWKWTLSRGKAIHNSCGKPIRLVGSLTDITTIKEREEALRLSDEKFRLAMESSNDAIYELDYETKMIRVTQSWAERFGVFQPFSYSVFLEHLHPEDRVIAQELLDGSNETINVLVRLRLPNSDWLWVSICKKRIFDSITGKPVRAVGIVRDINKLKKANEELERRVAERTKELEDFTYTVSHDIKAPLRSIGGYCQILQEECADKLNNEGLLMVRSVETIAQEAIELVDKLLEYSTTSKMQIIHETVNMADLVEDICSDLLVVYSGRNIIFEIQEDLPRVQADRVLLREAITNMLSNALKYTQRKERAIIKMKYRKTPEVIIFSIQDNGAGFDMRFAGKLFGIFQRLHSSSEFKGFGIGLATVRAIIEKHGGKCWMEGKVNEGATVNFTLPTSAISKNGATESSV